MSCEHLHTKSEVWLKFHITIAKILNFFLWDFFIGARTLYTPYSVYTIYSVNCQRSALNIHMIRMTTFLENLEMSGNFAVVREMSWKNLDRENCYSVCMVWVADTDCDMINAKTRSSHGSLASKKC